MASFWEAQTQPNLYGYRPNSSIRDLILMGGQERAQAADRSAAIWMHTLNNVGQQVGQGIQAYGEQKQEQKRQQDMAARDAATANLIQGWSGDPKELLGGLVKIRGPKEGTQMAETLLKFSQNDKDNNPESHLKTTHAALSMFLGEKPELQAATYQRLKAGLAPTIAKLGLPIELPDQLTPDVVNQLTAARDSLDPVVGIKPERDDETAVVGGALVNKKTGQVIYQGEPKAEKPPAVGSFEDFVVQKYGPRPTADQIASARKQYEASNNVDPAEKFQKVDVFNPETGETETKFVSNAEAGAIARGEKPGLSKGPAAATKTKMDAARASIHAGETLLTELQDKEFASKLGSVAGRWNSLAAAAGEGDPTAQYLVGALKSFSAMQPAVHGFRAVKMAQDIEQLLTTKQSPEAISGALKGILSASYNVSGKKVPEGSQPAKTIVDRGVDKQGRKIVKYSDGSLGYE